MQQRNAKKLLQRNWLTASFSTCCQENIAVFTDPVIKLCMFWNNFFCIVPSPVKGEGASFLQYANRKMVLLWKVGRRASLV